MGRLQLTRPGFDIYVDSPSRQAAVSSPLRTIADTCRPKALRDLPADKVQNRQSSNSSVESSTSIASSGSISNSINSLSTQFNTLSLRDSSSTRPSPRTSQQSEPDLDWQLSALGPRHFVRPSLTQHTFEPLETVPEFATTHGRDSLPEPVSQSQDCAQAQRYFKLPAQKVSQHPISEAAQNTPPADVQIAKHRDGDFDWILKLKIPVGSVSNPSVGNPSEQQAVIKTHLFGCNLLPRSDSKAKASDDPMKETIETTYVLLVTPVEGDEEPTVLDKKPADTMSVIEVVRERSPSIPDLIDLRQDNILEEKTWRQDEMGDGDKTATKPAKPSTQQSPRIEDSLEALDHLEDQLEAFDQAAAFQRVNPPKQPATGDSPSSKTSPVREAKAHIHAASQPKRTGPAKTGSATVRIKSSAEPVRSSIRKSTSMTFVDSPRTNAEGKKVKDQDIRMANPRPSSLHAPKSSGRSDQKTSVSAFELPGEAVARRLKEKREARAAERASAEAAAQAASLRRAKTVRVPTKPNFELPGEAISRRKREEREAQLKAQEEAERKRREFKAKPIRSAAATNSLPRETVASRARQQTKVASPENVARPSAGSLSKRSSGIYANSRPPLVPASNQSSAATPVHSRGRNLTLDTTSALQSRAVSDTSSAGGAKRGSISLEDAQQQRLRGQSIFKRDNSFSEDKEREKREREHLARIAREEAAERSRQKSREWAAKQARKRATVGSLRELVAASAQADAAA